MEELIAQVAQAAGIPIDQAGRAIGLVFAFLVREGPAGEVNDLLQMLPGATQAAEAGAADRPGGGIVSGLMGVISGGEGLMGLASRLTAIGLGTGEMASVGKEIFSYARTHVGEERVASIAAAIPGLSQII